MSLFVGNLSKNVRQRELEDTFGKFGECKVNPKVSHKKLTDRAPTVSSSSTRKKKLMTRWKICRVRIWAGSKSPSSGANAAASLTRKTAAGLHPSKSNLNKSLGRKTPSVSTAASTAISLETAEADGKTHSKDSLSRESAALIGYDRLLVLHSGSFLRLLSGDSWPFSPSGPVSAAGSTSSCSEHISDFFRRRSRSRSRSSRDK